MAQDADNPTRARTRRWRRAGWSVAAALMLPPALAMQVTDEMNWGPGDFALLGLSLAGVGVAFELAARVSRRRAYLAAVGVALAAAMLLVWINLAVGVIGSEDDPANRIYAGVLGVALVGAALARLRPLGMARAMVAAAVAQGLAFAVALVAGLGSTGPVTAFFAALWLTSAWLFREAAKERPSAAATDQARPADAPPPPVAGRGGDPHAYTGR